MATLPIPDDQRYPSEADLEPAENNRALPSELEIRLPLRRTFTSQLVLSGFMDEDHITGFMRGAGLDAAAQAQARPELLASRVAASQLAPVDLSDVITREVKDPHVDAIVGRQEFSQAFSVGTYAFVWIRPERVIAQQVNVRERNIRIPEDVKRLLEYGLPLDWSVPVETIALGPGLFHMVSSSPSFTGVVTEIDEVGRMIFRPQQHINLIQVVHFEGRYYARNGHNRLHYAAAAGAREIPALVRHVQTLADVALPPSPFMFNVAHSHSLARPPLVADLATSAAIRMPMRDHRRGFLVKTEVVPLITPV